MLLVSVWWRLLAAGIAVAGLWAAVLWVAPSTPSISSAEAPVRVAAPPVVVPVLASGGLRAVVQSGFGAPVAAASIVSMSLRTRLPRRSMRAVRSRFMPPYCARRPARASSSPKAAR